MLHVQSDPACGAVRRNGQLDAAVSSGSEAAQAFAGGPKLK
jgi:hypothetical protein